MSAESPGRRSARFAGVALLAFTVLATACGRPPDEAWLTLLGFGDTTSATSTSLDGKLRDGTALTAKANLQNSSLYVGQKVGTGILVNRARVDYRMSGYSPPSADYNVNLYLAPPADSKATTGTLTVSLASISLKQWLIDTGAFDDSASKPVVELTANVTFFGETDEGTKLEVKGSIGIALTNTGATTNTTNTTVSVTWNADASIGGPDGGFTVTRSGSTAAELEVKFATSGSADTTNDYYALGTSVLIPAGSKSTTIAVSARSTGTSGRTVIINLSSSTSYTVGTPSSASLQITGEVLPTVSIAWKADASLTGADGGFTVSRSGHATAELKVDFAISGSAVKGTDYYDFGTSMLFPPGAASATITVIAIPSGTSGRKVVINLSTSSAYKVGSPSSASLQIK